ncbi:ribonuclease H-like domain-containing protein [Tanacetum coccineum]|uniref:Ribonuclease H-like domain-containing protein n=1 Tax=Tanacetum coccineum TaxID=301880 RepID=A0ABQ5I993_9ASTR
MNRTLIEAARTMLVDSLLPTTFWAEAVSTACYIFNRVRVTKPQNKTPYELLFGHKPIISYIRPFGCHVTILDTLSVLGKFDGKSDEGMGHMGYPTDGSFTFWKSFFTPQWRFLVHHLLHCISSKSGGWDQFGSNIATALICQAHPDVAPSQPSSSTLPIPSPSSPPVQSPPPIPASTPTPIPETNPEPTEHTYEEPSPAHQYFSPPQEHFQGQMTLDQLMTTVDGLEKDLKQTKLTMGSAIVKLTTVNASGEEQVENISPNTLEAAKTLSRVASQKPKSIDKGRRYKRRKETKGKKVVTSLDFQEEVNTDAKGVNTAEGVNTGSIKVSTVSRKVSTVT